MDTLSKSNFDLTEEISKGLREIKFTILGIIFKKHFYNNENLLQKIDIIKNLHQ